MKNHYNCKQDAQNKLNFFINWFITNTSNKHKRGYKACFTLKHVEMKMMQEKKRKVHVIVDYLSCEIMYKSLIKIDFGHINFRFLTNFKFLQVLLRQLDVHIAKKETKSNLNREMKMLFKKCFSKNAFQKSDFIHF